MTQSAQLQPPLPRPGKQPLPAAVEIPALTAVELAERLAEIAGRLSEVIEAEVVLLQTYKVTEVESLQTEKQSLTQDYGSLMRCLEAHPEALRELDEARRGAVRTAAERLVHATEANAVALRAGLEANNRLMAGIARAVKEQRPRSAHYQANGQAIGVDDDRAPVSVSLNAVL